MKIKKISRLSMLLALSVVLGILESFIPLNGAVYGLKLGLANTVMLFVIYMYGLKDAILLSVLRVFFMGLLRTGLFHYAFFFSLGGAIFSILMMALAKKMTNLSVVGVSVLGAISHNLGQVIVGFFLLQTTAIFFYLPYLLLFAIPTGCIVGVAIQQVLLYYKNQF